MKPQTRKVPEREYFALLYKVIEAARITGAGYSTKFAMVDSDFLPTQNMAEARFLAWDNAHDCGLFQVDGVGTAVLLIRDDD